MAFFIFLKNLYTSRSVPVSKSGNRLILKNANGHSLTRSRV